MDVAHKETDAVIAKVEKKVKKEYAQAQKEIEKKADAYFTAFAEKDKKKLALVDAKEMSREAYNEWRKQQLLVGNKWDQMSISLSEELSNARKISASIVKGHMPEVYAENFNYSTYEIEAGLNINTSFTLYDKQTVERLLRENPKLLPDPSEKVKDKIRQKEIQRWSRQKMTSALTQAILQGESLDKLAKRLRSVTSMDAASSIRNARTMLTNAQSAGRYDGYRRAKDMGVKFKVMWIATLDGRTRHEHRLLDGQMQEVDEPFHVGDTEIMYPADYGGKDYKVPPDMIYNCRCTIGAAVKGTRLYDEGIGAVNRKVGTGQTYEDWKKGHPSRKKKINTPVATRPQNEPENLKHYNRYAGVKTQEDILKQTNPKYKTGREYQVNCQRCVVAEEMIYRGYDVTAKPYNKNDKIKNSGVAVWKFDNPVWFKDKDVRVSKLRSNFLQTAQQSFDEWGEGARAIVRVKWGRNYGNTGHFLFAVKEGNKIQYTDPQTGLAVDIKEKLKKCSTGRNQLWIMRVDNRELNDLVSEAVENFGGKR